MQSKIFTAAVAALSLSTVQCASVPRALVISPALIVLPGISFDPNTTPVQESVFLTLDLLREDIAKTALLVNQLTTNTGGGVLGTIAQATLVLGNVTANVATITTKITGLSDILKIIPPSPSVSSLPGVPLPDMPDLGGASENLVRTVQTLTRSITTQLEALRAQVTLLTAVALAPIIATAQLALQTALNAVGSATGLALSLAASASASVQAVLARVNKAQVKLNPVLILAAQPEIVF